MPDYRVTWEIDAENIGNMLEAAQWAREQQTAEGTGAVVFTVTDTETGESAQVDLNLDEDDIECCRGCGRVTRVEEEPVDTDAADGFDGYCGRCADRAEARGEWGA